MYIFIPLFPICLDDGDVFEDGCNTCMCIDGTIECTEKYCDYSQNGKVMLYTLALCLSIRYDY